MIKVCSFNKYYDEITDFFISKNTKFYSQECLDRCDLCHSGAFVQYNDKFISAENAKLLILKLEALNMV